jgi:penicillin-binding protein 1C
LALVGWLALPLVTLPSALFEPAPPQFELTDRNGIPLRIVRQTGQPFAEAAAFSDIPQVLLDATLAAEDKRFWRHPGVDWRGTLRAAWGLMRHRRVLSGGSTITQQLIKLTQPRPRTFRTKIIEAAQALRLEQVWDKRRILAEYLNRLDYGNLNTGCAAAAEFYFGKPLHDLSAAECALLAALPQAPTRLNPLRHWEAAHKRQQWVLKQMLENGSLTRDELDRARAENLRLEKPHRDFEAPHFVDLLLLLQQSPYLHPTNSTPYATRDTQYVTRPSTHASLLAHHFPTTTLDLPLNCFAETTLRRQIAHLHPQHVGNGAAVVIDNRTGSVLALVGSEDYFSLRAGQVNGAWAPRSAGSTFKPFTYLIALEQGATPASVVADVPAEFATATGLFAPVDYDRHCRGPMRYRVALANSLNIPAVKVLASIGGPATLQERLRACGLTTLTETPERYGLGLTIGNAEARLLELANAYACLARLGEYRPFSLIVGEGEDWSGAARNGGAETGRISGSRRAGALRFGTRQRLFDADACFLIADILSDNTARTPAFGAESSLRFEFPVACKTGTSSDFRDNWAFGYTPEFTVGVWVGNFDGSPMQDISGVTGAAPILHELFEHLHQRFGTSWYSQPGSIVEAQVHPLTGKRRPKEVAQIEKLRYVTEKFIAGHLPPEESADDYDSSGRIRLGPEHRNWFGTADNWLAGQAVVEGGTEALRIVFPLPGTKFFLDPDLPDGGRRIRLRVEGSAEPEWQSDTLECRRDHEQSIAFLEKGGHRLRVCDPRNGATQETWIEVLER